MSAFLSVCLIVASYGLTQGGSDRLNELFAEWEAAQQNVKSLVVEFTLEVKDPIFNKCEKRDGTFRMLRTEKGKFFAVYDVLPLKVKHQDEMRTSGLLNGGKIYLLNHDQKSAIRIEPSEGDVRGFLERNFNPLVTLLDRKKSEDKWTMEVKEDEWYTYLTLKAKKPTSGWWPESFQDCRVAILKKASKGVPKNMPSQVWNLEANHNERTYTITSWRINGDDAPQLSEFERPEARPGWQVHDWFFGPRKK